MATQDTQGSALPFNNGNQELVADLMLPMNPQHAHEQTHQPGQGPTSCIKSVSNLTNLGSTTLLEAFLKELHQLHGSHHLLITMLLGFELNSSTEQENEEDQCWIPLMSYGCRSNSSWAFPAFRVT